jgi:hypothetical protein
MFGITDCFAHYFDSFNHTFPFNHTDSVKDANTVNRIRTCYRIVTDKTRSKVKMFNLFLRSEGLIL